MNDDRDEYDDAIANKWYEDKMALMLDLLGDEHDALMHAFCSYTSRAP